MDKDGNVFEIEFLCGNCGHNWKEPFQKGLLVRKRGASVYVANDSPPKDIVRMIKCPNCETTFHIIDITRKVI